MADNSESHISDQPGFVLLVEIFYLLVLSLFALFYLTDLYKLLPFALSASFGPLAAGVPWFGALGAARVPNTTAAVITHSSVDCPDCLRMPNPSSWLTTEIDSIRSSSTQNQFGTLTHPTDRFGQRVGHSPTIKESRHPVSAQELPHVHFVQ
jgi:hypothetical protein